MNLFQSFFNSRFWSLVIKETRQILKNKQLVILLIIPPTIQLLALGFALSPDVNQLSLGVTDYAQTYQSRELVAALTENDLFTVQTTTLNEKYLVQQVRTGNVSTGLIIPPDFNTNLTAGKTAQIQVFIDAVDANTAGIANGYLQQILAQYNRTLNNRVMSPPIEPQVRFLYNPGLISSWFFVPGVMGLVLTLTGTLISSVTVIREKDVGTLEQLLMTPAAGWEILLAKIVPLFVLLMGDVLLAASLGRVVFALPFRGNFWLYWGLSGIYVVVCIGLGILLATISRTQQQVVLTSFFFNVPLIQLSGAIAPIESMPTVFRTLSWFNPLRHYVTILRNLILKGVGIEVVYPNVLFLLVFATLLLSLSINRFRDQLE
ncbi:ABC transporter permease [Spirulina sp. CS-785/01]|uniref:ABC transporter permease n=1 Tax=Spirulina sp. CS-785/01 TaxID=3021716 RepID=UPI00232F4E1E|nr:ABC transporter permease [Spirulina sp. CS-785/01]MDB9312923.1 ABC transporter permease [Spirulina sp. CS-785/01]